jgi:hypothetical protein
VDGPGSAAFGRGAAPELEGRAHPVRAGKHTAIDGPFTEAKELIAGFWMIQVKSKEEVIEWARRIPFESTGSAGEGGEVQLRQVFEASDFPPETCTSEDARAVLEAERAFRERTTRFGPAGGTGLAPGS